MSKFFVNQMISGPFSVREILDYLYYVEFLVVLFGKSLDIKYRSIVILQNIKNKTEDIAVFMPRPMLGVV